MSVTAGEMPCDCNPGWICLRFNPIRLSVRRNLGLYDYALLMELFFAETNMMY